MSATYKIKFGDDIRRVTLATAPTFGELVGMIREMYSINDQTRFTLKYQDDEHDLITVTCDAEVKAALDIAASHLGNMLRLFVTAINPRPEFLPAMRFDPSSAAKSWFGQRPPLPATEPGKSVHFGVTCDNCNTAPIIGTRFKCTNCPDYDLCEKCMAITPSIHDHAFREIVQSRHGGFRHCGRGMRRCGRPQEAAAQPEVKIDEQAPKSLEPVPVSVSVSVPAPAPTPAQPEEPIAPVAPVVDSTPTLLFPSIPISEPVTIPTPTEPIFATLPIPAEFGISAEEIQPLKALIEMGFGGDLIAALRRNGGDLEATILYLLRA